MRYPAVVLLALASVLPAVVPTASVAKSGDGRETEFVTYDIRGVYKGGMRVKVTDGNAHTRQTLQGKTARFDMRGASFEVSDTNDDGYRDWSDLVPGRQVRIRGEFSKHRPKTAKRPVDAVWSLADVPGGICAGLPGISRLCPF
jgi:hypothetical protein